jgi:hypothetical protein
MTNGNRHQPRQGRGTKRLVARLRAAPGLVLAGIGAWIALDPREALKVDWRNGNVFASTGGIVALGVAVAIVAVGWSMARNSGA